MRPGAPGDCATTRSRRWRHSPSSASVALRNALLFEAVADESRRHMLGRVADAIVATEAADDHVQYWNAAAEQDAQMPERRALNRVLAELLSSELGDADGSAQGPARRRRRDRHRGQALARRAGAVAVVAAADMSGGDGRPGTCSRCATSPRCAHWSSSRAISWPPSPAQIAYAADLDLRLRGDATLGEEARAYSVRFIASEAERLNRLVDGLLSAARLRRVRSASSSPRSMSPTSRATSPSGSAVTRRCTSSRWSLPRDSRPGRRRTTCARCSSTSTTRSSTRPPRRVTLRVRKRRRVVEMRVSDEGIGISERDQRNLFQKFFRVDAGMSSGIRGIGLGLYLVRSLPWVGASGSMSEERARRSW